MFLTVVEEHHHIGMRITTNNHLIMLDKGYAINTCGATKDCESISQ